MHKIHSVRIDPQHAEVDGKRIDTTAVGTALLKELYHTHIGGYPKFHKMDTLCQLGFVASELLLTAEGETRFTDNDDRAVILFGKHASIHADRQYQATIADRGNYFPSPAVFIYTLPNIVTGEIALRNLYHGETSYIAVSDKAEMERHMDRILLTTPTIHSAIYGWIDATGDNAYETEMWIIK